MTNKNLQIFNLLKSVIIEPKCELNFNSVFELLIAVVLSAQCTDKRVNMVTSKLFANYNTPQKINNLSLVELENIIKPCGFYKTKAKNIKSLCDKLINTFNAKVPNNIEDLMSLSGVGRKTASVVLSVGYKIPSMPVDTHVFRVSNRIGIVKTNNVLETEKLLKQKFNKNLWIDLHHIIILFGRYYCTARKPKCENCVIKSLCEYNLKKG